MSIDNILEIINREIQRYKQLEKEWSGSEVTSTYFRGAAIGLEKAIIILKEEGQKETE